MTNDIPSSFIQFIAKHAKSRSSPQLTFSLFNYLVDVFKKPNQTKPNTHLTEFIKIYIDWFCRHTYICKNDLCLVIYTRHIFRIRKKWMMRIWYKKKQLYWLWKNFIHSHPSHALIYNSYTHFKSIHVFESHTKPIKESRRANSAMFVSLFGASNWFHSYNYFNMKSISKKYL